MQSYGDVDLYNLKGDHYDVGLQQGKETKELTQVFLDVIKRDEEFHILKPWWVPTSFFIWFLKQKGSKNVRRDINKFYPKQGIRMKGISDGAEVDLKLVELACFFESYMSLNIRYTLGCTSFGVKSFRNDLGELVIFKNFDYIKDSLPLQIVRRCILDDGYSTLDTSLVPLPGCHAGINEYGLVVCYNYAFGLDDPCYNIPISILCQEMLENCKTTEEAVDFIKNSKRAGGALLLIGDKEEDLRSIELTSNHMSVHDDDGRGYIVNTNHYLTREMTPWDIPYNAVYSKNTPGSVQGEKVHDSSEKRYNRVRFLLDTKKEYSITELKNILRDHNEEKTGNRLTICSHGDYYSTISSLIFYPRRRTMEILYGKPCQGGDYQKLVL